MSEYGTIVFLEECKIIVIEVEDVQFKILPQHLREMRIITKHHSNRHSHGSFEIRGCCLLLCLVEPTKCFAFLALNNWFIDCIVWYVCDAPIQFFYDVWVFKLVSQITHDFDNFLNWWTNIVTCSSIIDFLDLIVL